MSNVWFLGDLHAGHKNIHKFRTQFESEEEHFRTIRANYASVVTKRDKVFFLGDTAFTMERLQDIKSWVGEKIEVLGNHSVERELTTRDYLEVFDDVQGFMKYKEFWLSHAPIHPNELRGKTNLHGHVHCATIPDDRYFNCSLENINYRPISLHEIRQIIEQRKGS